MEEMIKQWEVFHQSIETRIDERVIRHVDDKLTIALQDPSFVPPLLPSFVFIHAGRHTDHEHIWRGRLRGVCLGEG